MADKELHEILDEVAADAEAARGKDQDAPLPPHVTVSRPNRARSKVLQVRLNPEEMEAVERIAERRDLPPSTVARDWLLRMIRQDVEAEEAVMGTDVATLLHRLEVTVAELRNARDAECRNLPAASAYSVPPSSGGVRTSS